jgi:hypothetical protein
VYRVLAVDGGYGLLLLPDTFGRLCMYAYHRHGKLLTEHVSADGTTAYFVYPEGQAVLPAEFSSRT